MINSPKIKRAQALIRQLGNQIYPMLPAMYHEGIKLHLARLDLALVETLYKYESEKQKASVEVKANLQAAEEDDGN